MSAPQKITPDQIRWAREVMAKREDLKRQLELLPTMADIADELQCSERYLSDVIHNRARVMVIVSVA